MKWNTKQVEEMLAIKKINEWTISSWDGVLVKGKCRAALENALMVMLDSGFCIDHYTRSFNSGALIVFVEQ